MTHLIYTIRSVSARALRVIDRPDVGFALMAAAFAAPLLLIAA